MRTIWKLTTQSVIIALGLMVLIPVPSTISLLFPHNIRTIRVFLAIKQTRACSRASIVFRQRITGTPPITIDLHQPIIRRSIRIFIRRIAIERTLVFTYANHCCQCRLRKPCTTQIRRHLTFRLVVAFDVHI